MKNCEGKSLKSRSAMFIILFLFFAVGFGCIVYPYFYETKDSSIVEKSEDNQNFYDDATRELSEEGEWYSVALGSGYYKVGVHIPEGKYTISMESGTAFVVLDDSENGIFINGIITAEETEGGYEYIENGTDDFRLYKGAHLNIYTSESVLFATTNAQMPLEYMENPNTESITFSGEILVGSDIPAGAYDVICEEGTGNISVELKEEGVVQTITQSKSQVFNNFVFTEETEIRVDETMTITLTPSKWIDPESE